MRDAYERAIACIHEPQRIQPMSTPNPPVIAPEPPPSKPKVPFRARVISHQRANRKAASPIIMMGEPNRKLPERNPQPPKRRPKLERFRRDFLKNGWPQKRRRMVGMLLLPYDTDALDQEYARLSRWEQLHWHEDFGTLIEELKAEYEASLDELGIDADTAEYWAREPEVSYSKDLWRGSAIISAAVTVVVMLVIAGARLSDEMAYGPHPWWIEAIWVFGVIVTANRTWLSRRRRLWGLACATLLVPPYTMIPELAAPGLLLAVVPLTAATSFPRATTYILMGMASGVYFAPIAWLGEAVRWVLRVPAQHDPDNELLAAFKPGLVWLVMLSGLAGLVYDEPHKWTRIVFIALWIVCTEAFMAYGRSDRVTVR